MYEEALLSVVTVRDFTQVFDAYAQFEELLLAKQMEGLSAFKKPSLQESDEFELRHVNMQKYILIFDARETPIISLLVEFYVY